MPRSTAGRRPPAPGRGSCRRRSGRPRTTPSWRARPPAPRRRAGAAPAAARPVAVVYAEKYAASASTFLRGRQLAEMVAARDPDLADMRYTSDLAEPPRPGGGADQGRARGASGRGDRRARAAQHRGDRQLGRHAARGRQGGAATDGSMTLSHRQTTDFARLFPDRPGLPRHPPRQPQIRASTPPMDRPRVGYFGLPAQHLLPGEPRRADRPRRHRHRQGGDETGSTRCLATTATGSCAGGPRRTTAGSRSSRASSPPAATRW